jgi:hypothetical protein
MVSAKFYFLASGLTFLFFRILVDSQGTLKLNLKQFLIAMKLMMKLKNGSLQAVPPSIPAALVEAVGSVTKSIPGALAPSPTASPTSLSNLPSPLTMSKISSAQVPGGVSRSSTILSPPPSSKVSPGMDRRRTHRLPSSGSVTSVSPAFIAVTAATMMNSNVPKAAPISGPSSVPSVPWVIDAKEKQNSDVYFDKLDTAKKGQIDGLFLERCYFLIDTYEITFTGKTCSDFLLLSKLDRSILAEVWWVLLSVF